MHFESMEKTLLMSLINIKKGTAEAVPLNQRLFC